MFYEKCKVIIIDEKMCRVCRKKIGNRFVRFVFYVDLYFGIFFVKLKIICLLFEDLILG